jgi:hypothetical protein
LTVFYFYVIYTSQPTSWEEVKGLSKRIAVVDEGQYGWVSRARGEYEYFNGELVKAFAGTPPYD